MGMFERWFKRQDAELEKAKRTVEERLRERKAISDEVQRRLDAEKARVAKLPTMAEVKRDMTPDEIEALLTKTTRLQRDNLALAILRNRDAAWKEIAEQVITAARTDGGPPGPQEVRVEGYVIQALGGIGRVARAEQRVRPGVKAEKLLVYGAQYDAAVERVLAVIKKLDDAGA